MPPNITFLGSLSFSGCKNLRSIHIPASLKSANISDSAFVGCSSLRIVNYCGTENVVNKNIFQSSPSYAYVEVLMIYGFDFAFGLKPLHVLDHCGVYRTTVFTREIQMTVKTHMLTTYAVIQSDNQM